MKIKTNKKGFTVVELVIVIAVIGILSAILIPTFVGLTQNAKNAKIQTEVKTSYETYLSELGQDALAMGEIYFSNDDLENVYKCSQDGEKFTVSKDTQVDTAKLQAVSKYL